MNGPRGGQLRRSSFAVLALLSAGVGAAAGCGSSDSNLPYVPSAQGGRGSVSFDAGMPGTPPTIEIRSPSDGALLVPTSAPEVRARIVATSGLLEPTSLKFALTKKQANGAGGSSGAFGSTPAVTEGALTGPFLDSEFRGRLDLAGLSAGEYVLTVSATTTTGASAKASIGISLDAGPVITIVSPAAGSHQKGSLLIAVLVDSAPFEPTMLPLEATLAGQPVDLTPTAGSPNAYQGMVDFRSYEPPLRGNQLLTVAAKNAHGIRTLATAQFVVDEDGPMITDTTPLPSDVVGKVIEVSARVTDAAGVVDGSVIALIGDQTTPQFQLKLLPHGDGVYSAPFDTAQLTRCGLLTNGLPDPGTYCIVYPTVSFRASDSLGNETTLSYSFGVDNQPPLLDMNPPDIRIMRIKNGLQCSWAYDPLGNHLIPGNMPNDDCAVGQVFQLRVRGQDQVNGARYLQVGPLATIDESKIDVYVLNDTTQPLTVDSDGDGTCDLINPKLIPTTMPPTNSREVLKVRLTAVPPQGAANFTPDPSLASETRCGPGDDGQLPPVLCRLEEPTIAISYGPKLPAIWSLDPVEPMGLRCFGNQFDAYANHIGGSSSRGAGSPPPGWACIAVQATDRVGNTGVSAPLRVWIDYDGPHACPGQSNGATSPPPDCTGAFDRQTNTVTAAPCQNRHFERAALGPELCLNGNCQ